MLQTEAHERGRDENDGENDMDAEDWKECSPWNRQKSSSKESWSLSITSSSESSSMSSPSTTSRRSSSLPPILRARSQPINIRRPKHVLIRLDSGAIVTPSSSYGCDSESANGPESEEDISAVIESAILEPRSPPQEKRIRFISFADNVPELFTPSTSHTGLTERSSSPAEQVDEDDPDSHGGSVVSFASQAPQEIQYSVLRDSEVSTLDIGLGLLNEMP